jgi:hypothetical protein
LTGGVLRAQVAGVDDSVEFKLMRGGWTSDRGIVVSFEFPVETGMEFLQIMPAISFSEQQAHCAAGGDCMLRRMSAAGGSEPLN